MLKAEHTNLIFCHIWTSILCHCDQISSLWVSQSKANPGRLYFRCRDNEKNDKCDFLKWADVKKKTKSHARMQKRATNLKPLESSDEEQ